MDIQRPDLARKRRCRRGFAMAAVVIAAAALTIGLSRLEPAAPSVARAAIWTDTVKRGEMLRQVRGNGTLVPEQMFYVQADTDGRIERILVLPGAEVQADTVLLHLSNPELEQAAFDMEWQLKAAQAQLTRLQVQLESERLTQEAAAATLKADSEYAELEAQANEALAADGLTAGLEAKRYRLRSNDLRARYNMEIKRLANQTKSATAQIAVQDADLEKLSAALELARRKLAGLHVRAGVDGVLQQLGDQETLQLGQRISPSTTLAKIVQATQLKAEIKIAETQAKDIAIGQPATIDTRNGLIPGRVMRVDPSVQNGTVTVDVKLEGPLPRGARPDLSVDGTIQLEKLENVLYVGRPVNGRADSTASIFKIVNGGKEAVRVTVKFGRSSVGVIEITEGLLENEEVILSDMSQWDAHDRVRLN